MKRGDLHLIWVSMVSGAILLSYGILHARIRVLYGNPRDQGGAGTGADASIATGSAFSRGSGHGADRAP